ncbi:PREDICTED: RWD domain-containing protein 4-like isoform X2 [Priapulus caudatus]|uniref:RWD domain-containing protein 4-like isoform X2 n=1 Tax=Priapulus caudatus TaxID=37621 RepID=A0ABM1DQV2_PRICU|nr:PREDICTED: RWD domain-containing protein 4-like isoform X2 [Priapulus caudatus]XP_014662324.1 PREDICTED: RWD domain-containing protein 4-like isoform X2 [Priapulus caudatus]XP_014662325.1 PREDICTED: RWD domain-containing protein 4-like isoform X2 [Priapulus caudatus]
MTCNELQMEELEVLDSIYEGDDNFKKVNEKTFQYKYIHPEKESRSFLVEIIWGETYPEEKPKVSMGAFFNKHISDQVKTTVVTKVEEYAEEWIGSAMTYTLLEFVKENSEELMADQPDELVPLMAEVTIKGDNDILEKKIKEKKEQLSKSAKRKLADRTDHKGEVARGMDWVDIVKHLSQIGGSNHANS